MTDRCLWWYSSNYPSYLEISPCVRPCSRGCERKPTGISVDQPWSRDTEGWKDTHVDASAHADGCMILRGVLTSDDESWVERRKVISNVPDETSPIYLFCTTNLSLTLQVGLLAFLSARSHKYGVRDRLNGIQSDSFKFSTLFTALHHYSGHPRASI